MVQPNPTGTLPDAQQVGNADVEWDRFDSKAYFDYNYGSLRPDDAAIIKIVADFFATATRGNWRGRAIDVGTGANLYPALTMLPYCSDVTLFERAHSNREWLKHELIEPSKSWLEFWNAVADDRTPYTPIGDPLDLLHQRARVRRGNVFTLQPGQYDIGTMFFVAESITTRTSEFRRAVGRFVDALRPGSPFAAAFMRDSSGYVVGDQLFPACSIGNEEASDALAPMARNVEILDVASSDLREGYCGMMVATGFKKR